MTHPNVASPQVVVAGHVCLDVIPALTEVPDVRPGGLVVVGLAGARVLHFGYPPLMRRLYADGGAELYALLSAVRARGLVTSLDLCEPDPHSEAGHADWAALLARALPAVDAFAPSLDEPSRMLGPPDGALELGRTAWRGREVLAPCFRATRVAGTTGSGDCTITVGACSVEAPDATGGVPPWPDVAARLAAGWPRLPIAPALAAAGGWRRDALGTLFDPTSQEAS